MKRELIRMVFNATCTSFTFEVLSFVLLPAKLAPDLNQTSIIQTFIICFCCAFGAVYPFSVCQERIKTYIISYISMVVILFGLGIFVFGLIPCEMAVIVTILLCGIGVYGLCLFGAIQKDEEVANQVNRQLQKRRQVKIVHDVDDDFMSGDDSIIENQAIHKTGGYHDA